MSTQETTTLPRQLRRLLDGKTTPEQFIPRLTMAELCALGAPTKSAFVSFTDDDHCVAFYDVPKRRMSPREVQELQAMRHQLGRNPAPIDMPEGWGMQRQRITLSTIHQRGLKILAAVAAGHRVNDVLWRGIVKAAERMATEQ